MVEVDVLTGQEITHGCRYLFGQGNFWDQDQAILALFQASTDQVGIDQGLAASGYPIHQGSTVCLGGLAQQLQGLRLFRSKLKFIQRTG
jgi:hypothetical protein